MSITDVDHCAGEMPLERLEAEITELCGHLTAGECRWLLLIAEYDRRKGYETWGCHSIVQWLGWKCGLDARAARERVRVGRSLETLPLLRERFATGQISYSKIRGLTRIATPENETDLIMIADHATASQVERVVSSYRRVLSDEEELKETNESHKQRYFRLDPCDDGSFVINGRLPGETAKIVMAAIEAAQTEISDEPVDKGGSAEPFDVNISAKSPKSTTNADALVMMAESFLANGPGSRTGGDRYQIVVNVDADVLADNSEGTCELDGGPIVAAETARRLSCDASIVEMTEDEDTQPRQLAKRTRTIPPSIRRAVHLRDQGCRFPGCGSRIYVDVHHIKHWAHGGTHEIHNLVELCFHHHRLVHEGGWGIKPNDHATFEAIKPDGTVINEHARDNHISHGHAIEELNKLNGLGIDSDTCIPNWYGDPLNLNDIISGLWYVDHPPELN